MHAERLAAAPLLAKIHHQILGHRFAAHHRQALAVGPYLGAVAAAQNPVGVVRLEAVLAIDLAQELEVDQLPAAAAQLQIPERANGIHAVRVQALAPVLVRAPEKQLALAVALGGNQLDTHLSLGRSPGIVHQHPGRTLGAPYLCGEAAVTVARQPAVEGRVFPILGRIAAFGPLIQLETHLRLQAGVEFAFEVVPAVGVGLLAEGAQVAPHIGAGAPDVQPGPGKTAN